MAADIGLGLALNILFWLGVVAAVCCLGVFLINTFTPEKEERRWLSLRK
jgi:hypothetical protein